MPTKGRRVFSRELKLSAVQRMLAGERVSALSRELQVRPRHFYFWREQYLAGGADALRPPGRPPDRGRSGSVFRDGSGQPVQGKGLATAPERIAGLERKIGQQQVELDFFRAALRRVRELRQESDGRGAAPSTRSSKR